MRRLKIILRVALPPLLPLAFLGAVYWETFSRSISDSIDRDPSILLDRAIEFRVAHTNGYPTYLWFLKLLHSVVPGELLIAAANFSSAVFGLLALCLTYILFRKIGIHPAIASVSILFIGLRPIFWSKCLITEVYQLSNMLLILSLLCLHWTIRSRTPLPSFLLGLSTGLQLTHHPLGFPAALLVCGSGFFFLINSAQPHRVRSVGILFGGAAVALLSYVYLPISWAIHGVPFREGLADVYFVVTKERLTYISAIDWGDRWTVFAQRLILDVGTFGVAAVFTGAFIALTSVQRKERWAIALLAFLGGGLVPINYLLALTPWDAVEILAFFLLPIFSMLLFVPIALQAMREPLGRLLGGRWKGRGGPVFVICLAMLVLSWSDLRKTYPLMRQRLGDLRYRAVEETLEIAGTTNGVYGYSIFGNYESWELLALLEYGRRDLPWSVFAENPHRETVDSRPALVEMIEQINEEDRAFYILTDSAREVMARLGEAGFKHQIIFHTPMHERPSIRVDEKGRGEIQPRNWLDLVTGFTVWELGVGFTTGYAFQNIALEWGLLGPHEQTTGVLAGENAFASPRYSRQRVLKIEAAFDRIGAGGNPTTPRLWLELYPLNPHRPPGTWRFKERVGIPISLDFAPAEGQPGRYDLTQLAFFPPFDENLRVHPAVQTLLRVWK